MLSARICQRHLQVLSGLVSSESEHGEYERFSTTAKNNHKTREVWEIREIREVLKMQDQRKPHHHHHLVCVKTNRVIEFKNDQILTISKKVADKYGFSVLDCQLTIIGVSPEGQRSIFWNQLNKKGAKRPFYLTGFGKIFLGINSKSV